jgi:hypothetical protein
MARTFRNPANGHTESISREASGLVVLFGALYLACKGLWGHFFLWLLLVGGFTLATGGPGVIIALPIVTVAYAFSINRLIANSYLRKGWIEVLEPSVAKAVQATNGLRECPYCAELIKVQAIKCKHCGSDVEPVPFELAETVKVETGLSSGQEWFVSLPFESNKEYRSIAEKVRELGHEVHSENSRFLRVGPYSTKAGAGEILRLLSMKHDLQGALEEAVSTSSSM